VKRVSSRNVNRQHSLEDVLVAFATLQRPNLVLVIIAQVTRQSGAQSGIRAIDSIDDPFPV